MKQELKISKWQKDKQRCPECRELVEHWRWLCPNCEADLTTNKT